MRRKIKLFIPILACITDVSNMSVTPGKALYKERSLQPHDGNIFSSKSKGKLERNQLAKLSCPLALHVFTAQKSQHAHTHPLMLALPPYLSQLVVLRLPIVNAAPRQHDILHDDNEEGQLRISIVYFYPYETAMNDQLRLAGLVHAVLQLSK